MRVQRQNVQNITSFEAFDFKTSAFAFLVVHSKAFKEIKLRLATRQAVLSIQAFLIVAKRVIVAHVTAIAHRIDMLYL